MPSYVHHHIKKYFKPMINHLASKYSYLASNKSLLEGIFDNWFRNIYPCKNISSMVEICIANADQWNKNFKKEFLKQQYVKRKYAFILDYKPENCHSAMLAAEFYGENFDTFVDLCTSIVKFTKIQQQLSTYPDLCDKLINFIKCYIMLIMGHIFYYLSIGVRMNNLYIDKIDWITTGIIQQIGKDNTRFSYKNFCHDNKSLMHCLENNYRAGNNENKDFDDYMKETLQGIWDKYQKTITNFEKLNVGQIRDKLNSVPEFYFVSLHSYPLQKKSGFPRMDQMLTGFLVYTMQNKNEKSPKETINTNELYPRITKFPEMYLVIEV